MSVLIQFSRLWPIIHDFTNRIASGSEIFSVPSFGTLGLNVSGPDDLKELKLVTVSDAFFTYHELQPFPFFVYIVFANILVACFW